jgi:hypothetical protein
MALRFLTEAEMKRPNGLVWVRVFYSTSRAPSNSGAARGRLIYETAGENLFVNAGLPALAALIGGDTTGQFAAAIGFGSGAGAPTVNDIGLSAPAYYKVLDSHGEDGGGSVTFNWSLTTSDTGAQGITIQELALFANHASIALPGSTAPTPMLARKTVAPIVFGANMSVSGTWTLTF